MKTVMGAQTARETKPLIQMRRLGTRLVFQVYVWAQGESPCAKQFFPEWCACPYAIHNIPGVFSTGEKDGTKDPCLYMSVRSGLSGPAVGVFTAALQPCDHLVSGPEPYFFGQGILPERDSPFGPPPEPSAGRGCLSKGGTGPVSVFSKRDRSLSVRSPDRPDDPC